MAARWDSLRRQSARSTGRASLLVVFVVCRRFDLIYFLVPSRDFLSTACKCIGNAAEHLEAHLEGAHSAGGQQQAEDTFQHLSRLVDRVWDSGHKQADLFVF